MAVLTAKGISDVAIQLLQRQLVLVPTVTAVPGDEFVGPNGGTITLRVPQPGASRTQTNDKDALTADDISEIPVDVTLGHVYHLKDIGEKELALQLEDFAAQVTKIQVQSVTTGAENTLVSVMNGLSTDAGFEFAVDMTDADTKEIILEAREQLGKNGAPLGNRYLAVSSDIASRILNMLTPVTGGGLDAAYAQAALAEATIGRIYGFTVVESTALTAGTAVAYHSSGFAFANRAPATPKGATQSSVTTVGPFSLRQVFQYDAGHAMDQSLLSTFAGAAAVYEDGTGTNGTIRKRFIKLDTAT